MAKAEKPTTPAAPGAATPNTAKFDFAKYAAARARAGDPYPLIGRLLYALRRDPTFSNDEIVFIRDALEATGKGDIKIFRSNPAGEEIRLEWWLIAQQYDGLIDDDGDEPKILPKNAMDKVMRDRGYRERQIRTMISRYGKQRRKRRTPR